jgi:hypothetical protein
VSNEVRDLHHIKQCGLHGVLGPWMRDNFQIVAFSSGQILMWGEHVVSLPVTKVEVTELQCYELILVGSNYTYPFREVRCDQSIVKILGHTVSLVGTT